MKLTDCKKLSLKNVKISGDVIGKFGTFETEQTFVNNTRKVLEVGYTFPIAETATAIGFEVYVGDKVMKGQCKETGKAKEEYTKNIVKGNSAYLMEQRSENIFSISIGKIAKGEEVKIKINYIDKFEIVDNKVQIFIPTLVPPKYNCKITDKLKFGKVDYTVDFQINIAKNVNFKNIESPTHRFKFSENENGNLVEVLNYDMSKDFKLNFELVNELTSNALVSKTRDGNNVLYMSFMPEITDSYEDSEKEYLFLVDISGSMCGEKIEETKHAVIECLKQLDNGDKFNIIPFESNFNAMAVSSLEYNAENLKKAISYVKSIEAGGGTEILDPIKFALYEEDSDKVVLLFTDGEVGNEEEIITFVENNIGKSRLFPFGIDYNVNSYFLRDLAKVGNGKAELIMPQERIDDKIIRTFARIQTPLLEELKIDYGKNKLVDEIREDNALFNYEFYNVFAKTENLEDDIILKGNIVNKEYSWIIKKDEMIQTDVDLEILFAKMEMDRLEDYIRNCNDYEKSQTYKNMIIELSEKYNINSKYTSFLTIYEREDKILEAPEYQETTLSSKNTFLGDIASKFSSMRYSIDFDGCFDSFDSCDDYEPSGNCLYSLEAPIGNACDSRLGDFIEDRDVGAPVNMVASELLKEDLSEILCTLSPREQEVLRLRFGLNDDQQRTLEEVADIFGITKEKVREIEAKALRKLRHPNRRKRLEEYVEDEPSVIPEKTNREKLEDKVDEYFEEFIKLKDKSIITYLLFAFYCNIKRRNFDYSKLFAYLHANMDIVLTNGEIQELIYLLFTKIIYYEMRLECDFPEEETCSKFSDLSLFYECMTNDTRKAVDTGLNVPITRKGIEEKDISDILEKNTVSERIDSILWYYCS